MKAARAVLRGLLLEFGHEFLRWHNARTRLLDQTFSFPDSCRWTVMEPLDADHDADAMGVVRPPAGHRRVDDEIAEPGRCQASCNPSALGERSAVSSVRYRERN